MADNPGALTQAIANLRSVSESLEGLAGLPAGADAARVAVLQSVNGLIPVAVASSQSVMNFVAAARPLLEEAAAAVEAHDVNRLKAALAAMEAGSAEAKTAVGTSTAAIQATMEALNAQFAVLSGIDSGLSVQIARAGEEARSAQASVDELNKKKLYWLIAGPFGLIGLGVCIGMIVTANNNVADIQGRISALRAQAAQWTKMKADVDLALSELPPIGARLQNLQNGVDFLSSDVSQVIEDVEHGSSGSVIAKAFLMTAGHELDVLAIDAA